MDARPHGFRSSFRDWMADKAGTPYEIAETCLGHIIGGGVERAYRRTDYLDQRMEVVEAWGNFVSGNGAE